MKFKFTWGRKLIAGILLAAVVVGGTAAPAEAAGKKSTAVVAQEKRVPDLDHQLFGHAILIEYKEPNAFRPRRSSQSFRGTGRG